LNNCIILIDPSLNPDGLQRHSTWANEHKSKNLNPDENGREFNDPGPEGERIITGLI
jgi:murein tripeptide amidase MpaA